MEQNYNAYIAKIEDFKAVVSVARSVPMILANTMASNFMEELDTSKYFPIIVPYGSVRDLELNKDLN